MVGFPSIFSSTLTAFIMPLTRSFGWGRAIPSMMYLAGTVGVAISSIWLGRAIERLGAARVAAGSGVALAGVLAALSLQRGAPAEAIGLCFVAGALGAGTGAGLWLGIPPSWFDAHLGRALGVTALGQSLGLAILPAIASLIINGHGWRAAYDVLAAIELLVTLCAAAMVFWLSGRERVGGTAPVSAVSDGMELREAVRTASFWGVVLVVGLVSFGVVGVAIHLFPLYIDRGAGGDTLAGVALELGAGTVLGRVGSGVALDHLEARTVAAALFTLGAAGIIWLSMLPSVTMPLDRTGPPLLIGLALGAESDLLAFLARRLFGMRHLSVIYNRLLIAFYVGAVAGTSALGWAADERHSDLALWGAAGACILAAMAALALPSTRRRASRLP